MNIKFIKNPVGKYNLSYEVGEVVSLPDAQAKELIEDKYAEQTKEEPYHHVPETVISRSTRPDTAESKVQSEKEILPSGKKK